MRTDLSKSQIKGKKKSSFQTKPISQNTNVNSRLILVWLILLISMTGLTWRLFQLQIIEGQNLENKARQQQMTNFNSYIPRRSIIDTNNNVLATDKIKYELYAHPSLLGENQTAVSQELANILLNKTQAQILARFKTQPTGILLEKDLTEEQAERIKALKSDGLEVIQRYSRFYPQNDLVASVVGYVDISHTGQAGVEYSYQKSLVRDSLPLRVKRSGKGTIMPSNLPPEAIELDDLQLKLTIDLPLQRAVQESLHKYRTKFNSKRGAVIVMDVNDGSILALATDPSYDPNNYSDYSLELFKNWTITDAYEPGSTFKPINVAIAIDAGVINADSYIHDGGSMRIEGWDIANYTKEAYGSISITTVLEKSSNMGMVEIIKKLDRSKYYEKLQDLGIGKITGVDLPFEAAGYIKDKDLFTARLIEPAVASFGQGFSLTPLQLVQIHAAIANGGKLVKPHVVAGLVDSQGNLQPSDLEIPKQIFSPSTANSVAKMMESVVANGTGKPAKIEGYRIGGKTGTAQKANQGGGGYLANAKITSFISIFPINNPRYVVLAIMDEPKGSNTFGSTVTAPIVKEVLQSLISLKGIPRTN